MSNADMRIFDTPSFPVSSERTGLLPPPLPWATENDGESSKSDDRASDRRGPRDDLGRQRHLPSIRVRWALIAASACLLLLFGSLPWSGKYSDYAGSEMTFLKNSPLYKKRKKIRTSLFEPIEATKRCDYVVETFCDRYKGIPYEKLKEQYAVQSQSANVFYRATALLFWLDFSVPEGRWAQSATNLTLCAAGIIDTRYADNTEFDSKSLWTWTTGDQHLSNFGAWRNRHGDVVFSVNDFDEAAIYDFHIDVVRVLVSVVGHAASNGLSRRKTRKALRAFTDTYVKTVCGYVGGDKEQLYELTPETARGALKKYLKKIDDGRSTERQMEKFTDVDAATNERYFLKNNVTRLQPVAPSVEAEIREAFTSRRYGATMMKMGWHVREWDDEYFEILDVARRVGSGVGSYGVDRYFVLLRGEDGLLAEDGQDGAAVILDVKFEPKPAVAHVLNEDDQAWYDVMFAHEAERAVTAQRRLTSYVDPFTGWVILQGRAFIVRQRSPWQHSPDLDLLTDPDDFIEFMEQVAVATATSHARGTVCKSPAQFKHVIASALRDKNNQKIWGDTLSDVAFNYREQVELDYECFKEYVNDNYSS